VVISSPLFPVDMPGKEVIYMTESQTPTGELAAHAVRPARTTCKKYRTILADPPWDVEQKGARGAEQHYRLMTLEQIAAMPVGDLAEGDAHLWLWVTNATLRAGYDIAEAWGFTVRSPLTWVKFRLGLGVYLRNSTEHLLFATRATRQCGSARSRRGSTHR
jgi:N6-adenosine-specific RNA methylase IME4